MLACSEWPATFHRTRGVPALTLVPLPAVKPTTADTTRFEQQTPPYTYTVIWLGTCLNGYGSFIFRLSHPLANWRNKLFVRPFEMILGFGQTKDIMIRKFRYSKMHNVIWPNQTTESLVYNWLCAHVVVHLTCFPTFVGPLEAVCKLVY